MMNRQQRRQQKKIKEITKKAGYRAVDQVTAGDNPEFSGISNATICMSIRMLINELRKRGYPMYDFDNKERILQQVQIIKNRIYFLAAPEENCE